jgi:hypothetical protein
LLGIGQILSFSFGIQMFLNRLLVGFVFICVALAGFVVVPLGHAEEIPRPELGCQVFDSGGNPLDAADLTSQQRVQVIRCMNAADREREWQSRVQKSQEQTTEILRNARRVEIENNTLGYGVPPNPSWLPLIRPRVVP